MFCARLCLKHILTKKVVLARHDAIVLDVQDLLREVLTFAVRVQTQVAYIKTEPVEPLL